METEKEVLEWAKLNEISIYHNGGNTFFKFVDAYAPPGMWFVYHDNHRMNLWDSEEKPDWGHIGKQLLASAELIPCPRPDCMWCDRMITCAKYVAAQKGT